MSLCLIVQPIHDAGIQRLRAAGIEPRLASRPDMTTVGAEIAAATAVITRGAGLSAAAMERAPRLRVVISHGVGVDAIAVDCASKLGIAVANTPDANRDSVAEHTMALMLAVVKRVPAADAAARRVDFDFKYRASLRDLSGKVLGVVGYGGIGRRVAAMARAAFAMEVVVHSASADPAELYERSYRPAASLEALLEEADVVSLHRTLRPESDRLISGRELKRMKPTAILINTARGRLVDEAALVAALSRGELAGAGLDVYESEQMLPDHPLLSLSNVVLTPHSAGSSEEALRRTAEQAAEQVVRALAGGRPANLVNPEMWDRRRR